MVTPHFTNNVINLQQESLRALWHCAFPNVSLESLISDQWKDMGWQGPNPSTDFRYTVVCLTLTFLVACFLFERLLIEYGKNSAIVICSAY